MRVVAIGRTEILYDSIIEIKKQGHEIVLIITAKEAPEYSRGVNDFKNLARKYNIAFIEGTNINNDNVFKIISDLSPDIGISMNWITLIEQKIINCFKYGIINAHAGDLPKYRGNAVANWAMINGEMEIVQTLHFMSTGLDDGDILLQRKIQISPQTRIGDIFSFSRQIVPKMFVDVLHGLQNGTILPKKQPTDPKLVLRCYPRSVRDGEIDWNKPADKIEKLVNALSEPFPGAYSFIGKKKVVIWRGYALEPPYRFLGVPGQVAQRYLDRGDVAIVTGKGLFIIQELQYAKEKERRKPIDIIKTIRCHLGMDITNEILCLIDKVNKLEKRDHYVNTADE